MASSRNLLGSSRVDNSGVVLFCQWVWTGWGRFITDLKIKVNREFHFYYLNYAYKFLQFSYYQHIKITIIFWEEFWSERVNLEPIVLMWKLLSFMVVKSISNFISSFKGTETFYLNMKRMINNFFSKLLANLFLRLIWIWILRFLWR